MPITHTIKIQNEKNLERAITYILNPEKTKNQTLTSGYKINYVNNANFEMKLTRKMARMALGQSNKKSDQEIIARHIIQSFDPNDALTPEEIHEIGRQTVLELTGGNHEFVIATHVDQDHCHNHIIFNATSSVDLKKFRWQKGTTNLLRNISDKIADYHGAMILDAPKRTSHAKYEKYKRENSYRQILKERLNFLLRHALNFEDFKQKAQALHIQIDEKHQSKDYGRVINYQLMDFPQKRSVRDYTLNKKNRSYSLEKIMERLKENHEEGVYRVEEINQAFQKEQKQKAQEPDLEFVIQTWQIERDTIHGVYVRVNMGVMKKE
ncbi:relaxase/mobilization nuclease domain-containing protein [Lactococcus lactis]